MLLMVNLMLLGLAYLIGSLPLGHWLLRMKGKQSHHNSVHNLGIQRVLQNLGPQLTFWSSAGDAAKGFLAISLCVQHPELCLWVMTAVYLGHLFPFRPLTLLFTPEAILRGRGVFVLLGALVGVLLFGTVPVWAGFLSVLLFWGVLQWAGYISLATLTSLGLFTVFGMLFSASTLAPLVLLGLAIWRHKEHIGRMIDGTEPRFSEPVATEKNDVVVAAFMIHPMQLHDLWSARRFTWLKPLVEKGLITEGQIRWISDRMRPMKLGELKGIRTAQGQEIRCYLLSAPLLPDRFRDDPELATKRAIQGAKLAHELGATVFGLGAFWSVVGNKGLDVQEAVPEITVTNGGAYTSGTIKAAIPAILQHFKDTGRDLSHVTAGVVGANGVVAFGIARTIAAEVKKIILIGRDLERLERSAESLRRANRNTEVVATLDYDSLQEADLIFSATSDPNPVIFKQHVRAGAWIFDEGRPPDVAEEVKLIPDVRVIPGGLVRPPGAMTTQIDLQFGTGNIPACLAETLIIAATGAHERKSLGSQTLSENINFFVKEANRLGFKVVES